jgi:hypothetical protein
VATVGQVVRRCKSKETVVRTRGRGEQRIFRRVLNVSAPSFDSRDRRVIRDWL